MASNHPQQCGRFVAIAALVCGSIGYAASIAPPVAATGRGGWSAPHGDATRFAYGALTAQFVENRGQAASPVRFVSEGGGKPIFFTDRDVRLVIDGDSKRVALILELSGANADVSPIGERPSGASVTYLARRGDATLPAFRTVVYPNAWPGIDARFRGEIGALKYEFTIQPGGQVDDVKLRFHGAHAVEVNAGGALAITTAAGTIVDAAPQSYEIVDGDRRPVSSAFRVLADGEVGFTVGPYDASRPLVIDPSIVYATFLGGSGHDEARAIAVDAAGAAYVAGNTRSVDFPATAGAFHSSGGNQDAFVAKINPNGDQFEYVTHFGGGGDDTALGIAVDSGGNAYVAGGTGSTDFPVTGGAFRSAPGSVNGDGFLAKLNPAGTALVFSTYLGGNSATLVRAIAVDRLNRAYVAGETSATNLPLTAGSVTSPHTASGNQDAFVLNFTEDGSGIRYGSYLGGSGNDSAWAIAVDDAGAAYLGGSTNSQDLPTSPDAPQRSLNISGVAYDAWVAKVDTLATNSTAALVYGSYIGGSGGDIVKGIAVDSGRATYLAVQSASYDDFPLTEPDRVSAAVAMKVNPSGTAFEYSRAVGPTYRGYTIVEAIAIDAAGNAYLTGSSDDESNYGWISRVDPNGFESSRAVLAPQPSQYTDWPYAIAVDSMGDVYVAGRTASAAFPVTDAAPQKTLAGGHDAFIAKVTFAEVPTANVAKGARAVASSVEGPEYAATNAVDGSLSTRWSSEFSDPQWIYVDLGERKQIQRVVLHWETAYARFYQLQVSDDATNWTPLGPGTIASDGNVDNFIDLNGVGRYVRVYGTARATEWGYSLWEIKVYGSTAGGPPPPPQSTNLARERFTYASSVETGSTYYPQYAVDGSVETRWSSEFSDPQWIYVDLGQTIDISRVVLKWETAYGADYQIQVSNDITHWTTVRTVTNGDGGVDDLSGLAATGRFVRMFGTRRGTEWGYSLWEFEVYGAIAQTSTDVVLYATDPYDDRLRGWERLASPSSPNGIALLSRDEEYSSIDAPPALGDPSGRSVDFYPVIPESGVYKVWVRLKATSDSKYNDSVWVQFSQATVNGAPVYELGSQSGLLVNLEDCSGCGVSDWGWQDNAWWLEQPTTVALPAGTSIIRVFVREDGVMLDQIVLSPSRYLTDSPGALKNDATIVPR